MGQSMPLPAPTLSTTITLSTVTPSSAEPFRASSAIFFRVTGLPPRKVPSEVITREQRESTMRSFRDSAENPPKTTLWMAPRREQASMEMGSSGIMGR